MRHFISLPGPGPALAAALLLSSPALAQHTQIASDNEPTVFAGSEAYNVYSAILQLARNSSPPARSEMLVIGLETASNELCLQPEEESREVMKIAMAEYIRLNQETWFLRPSFHLKRPYRLVAGDELKATVKQEGWDGFDKKCPDSHGWIVLSAVGFNLDETVAVVYMGHDCGILCGGGDFFVMEKKDGKWVPLRWKGATCGWRS